MLWHIYIWRKKRNTTKEKSNANDSFRFIYKLSVLEQVSTQIRNDDLQLIPLNITVDPQLKGHMGTLIINNITMCNCVDNSKNRAVL